MQASRRTLVTRAAKVLPEVDIRAILLHESDWATRLSAGARPPPLRVRSAALPPRPMCCRDDLSGSRFGPWIAQQMHHVHQNQQRRVASSSGSSWISSSATSSSSSSSSSREAGGAGGPEEDGSDIPSHIPIFHVRTHPGAHPAPERPRVTVADVFLQETARQAAALAARQRRRPEASAGGPALATAEAVLLLTPSMWRAVLERTRELRRSCLQEAADVGRNGAAALATIDPSLRPVR